MLAGEEAVSPQKVSKQNELVDSEGAVIGVDDRFFNFFLDPWTMVSLFVDFLDNLKEDEMQCAFFLILLITEMELN